MPHSFVHSFTTKKGANPGHLVTHEHIRGSSIVYNRVGIFSDKQSFSPSDISIKGAEGAQKDQSFGVIYLDL